MSRLTPAEARPIELKILPDGRRRLTRFRIVATGFGVTDLLVKPWGQLDAGPVDAAHQREGFANLRLVNQYTAEPGTADVSPEKLVWVEVYETLPATAEVQVGGNTTTKLEDGRTALLAESLQFSTATFVPGTVGTTTHPTDAAAFLQEAKATDDGTLRRISRTYVYSGVLSQVDETRHNGALLLRTIVSVKDVPDTPSGYALISAGDTPKNGLTVHTYVFAKGAGLVSATVETNNNGKLIVYRRTALGTAPTAPTATIAGTVVQILATSREDSGHTVYDTTWAEGKGTVLSSNEVRNNGKLVIYKRVALATGPNVPSATIGGTVVQIETASREESGHTVYDYTWAEGKGTVLSSNEVRNKGKLVIYKRVALGTGPSAPSATIGGTVVQIETASREESGHTVYDYTWAEGLGTVISSDETRHNGKLVIYKRVALGTAPTAPSATLAGTVVQIDATTREESGHTVYDYTWAEGKGTVISSNETRNAGKLVIYKRVALGTGPSAPSATIGGTVVQIDLTTREESGHTVYDYTWAEGKGVIGTREQQRPGGLKLVTWVSLGQTYNSAYMLPTGILMAKDSDDRDGHTLWTVTTMQLAAGGADPTTGTALSIAGYHPFRYPGRAKAIATTILGYVAYEVYRAPPADVLVDSTRTITYSTTASVGTLASPLWNPDSWATIFAKYWTLAGWPKVVSETLPGYRSISETPLTFAPALVSCLGELCYPTGAGTPYSLAVLGGPASPEGNTYTLAAEVDPEPAFVAFDGTKYYRRTIVTATIPTQTALPV